MLAVHVAQQLRADPRRSSRRDCRSARRRAAAPAGTTSARATATRCCSPPDSAPGRCERAFGQPDAREQRRRRARRARRPARPAMRSGISTFSSAVNSGSRWWNWKTKPTCRLRNAHARLVVHRVDRARRRRGPCPASNASRPPSTCSSVLLPTPDAPTIASISPRSTDEIEPAQHVDAAARRRVRLDEAGDSTNAIATGSAALRPDRAAPACRDG